MKAFAGSNETIFFERLVGVIPVQEPSAVQHYSLLPGAGSFFHKGGISRHVYDRGFEPAGSDLSKA